MVGPRGLLAVLDWEISALGDPLMDLGNSLAYWIDGKDPWLLRLFRLQPTHLPGMFSRDGSTRALHDRDCRTTLPRDGSLLQPM